MCLVLCAWQCNNNDTRVECRRSEEKGLEPMEIDETHGELTFLHRASILQMPFGECVLRPARGGASCPVFVSRFPRIYVPTLMNRRDFARTGLAAGVASVAGLGPGRAGADADDWRSSSPPRDFHLAYAPHFGTFDAHAGSDPVAQLEFAAEQGFTAWEDNGMKGRPVETQRRIAGAMDRLGIKMGVFVAHEIAWREPTLASGETGARQAFLDQIRESVDVAQRVGATWMTVVPGRADPGLEPGYQRAHVVEALRAAAGILEPHDLVMVLEPLNPWTDHPGMFLQRIPQAYDICRAVDSPACKILFDVYHQQVTEGNLIPNIDRAWDEIAYVQVGDNPGRNEPTTGEINYRNVFRHLHAKGFDGVVGMEHGQSVGGREGEQAVIDAYRAVDDFEPGSP